MYRLLIEDDEGRTTIVPLIRNQINIGREEGNTIRLTERNVSRRHARLALKDGKILIEDLQSYNGVWLNGDRIQGTKPVQPGDLLEIGDYHLSIQEEASDVEKKARPSLPPEKSATAQTPPLGVAAIKPSDADVSAPPSKLIVMNTSLQGQQFLLDLPEMTIGRVDENDIFIDHASVSRNHAKMVMQGDAFQLVDLGSANGIQVNGEEYGVCDLRWGDIIELGQVRLQFASADDPLESVPPQPVIPAEVPRPVSNKTTPIIIGALLFLLLVGGAAWYLATNGGDPDKGSKGSIDRSLPSTANEDLSSEAGRKKALKRAQEAFAQEEYEEALKLINKLLTFKPKWEQALQLKKSVLSSRKDLKKLKGADDFKISGDYHKAYKLLGEVQSSSRYYSRAQKRRKDILPKIIEELMDKATRFMSLKEYKKALSSTDEVLILRADHPGALAMQKTLKDKLQQDPDEPGVGSPKPRRRRPRRRPRRRRKRPSKRRARSGVGYSRCLNKVQKKQNRAALSCFKRYLARNPSKTEVYVFMGIAAAKLGRCRKRGKGRNILLCMKSESYYREYLKFHPKGSYANQIKATLPKPDRR